jgi:hypothetical protein
MRTLPALALLLAACGSGSESISVEGDFASPQTAPGRVYALEARVDAEVKDGAFSLGGLATSPISLRMVRNGDTVGQVDIADLAPGSGLVLHGLRTDPRSGRAFPTTVELSGASVVRVNGIRMMNPDALPSTVDAAGVVLAASDDRAALLVRPADEALPDLRVVVAATTSTLTRDSLAADLGDLSVGDSVHVHGPAERGFVLADRLTLLGASPASTVSALDRDEPRSAASSSGPSAPAIRTSSPVVRTLPVVRREGQGEGRGRGRDDVRKREEELRREGRKREEELRRDAEQGRGNGNGNGNKKGKGRG